MKKHYLTLTRLLMVMLMAVGFSTAGQAAESRGDSIYNTASTDLQSVIRDINNLSLQYQNVTSIRNFLDEMASQGTATLKNTNSKWQIKKTRCRPCSATFMTNSLRYVPNMRKN